MTYTTGTLLGALQGLTEFLPISSSGHLIIARELFGLTDSGGLAFDAILQLGTIFAVFIFFRRDVLQLLKTTAAIIFKKPVAPQDRTLLIAIIIGTVPALIAGLALEQTMETVFRSAALVAVTLVVGSLLMWVAEKRVWGLSPQTDYPQTARLTVKQGFWIGVFQCLALVPGMSRSGSTISGGLLLGLSREEAARFSFLLSMPIILGSGLKKLYDLLKHHELSAVGPEIFVGFFTAFIVGYACIAFLLKYLKTHSLNVFIYYRLALAVVVFIAFFAR